MHYQSVIHDGNLHTQPKLEKHLEKHFASIIIGNIT